MDSRFPPPSKPPTQRPAAGYALHALADDLTETVFEGHLSAALVDAADRAYHERFRPAARFSILNGTRVTGYDPTIALRAAAAVRRFRENGGQTYLVVIRSGPIRMMAAALFAAERMPFRVFETRDDAIAWARAQTRV